MKGFLLRARENVEAATARIPSGADVGSRRRLHQVLQRLQRAQFAPAREDLADACALAAESEEARSVVLKEVEDCLHAAPKEWRRIYGALVLLEQLLRHGGERGQDGAGISDSLVSREWLERQRTRIDLMASFDYPEDKRVASLIRNGARQAGRAATRCRLREHGSKFCETPPTPLPNESLGGKERRDEDITVYLAELVPSSADSTTTAAPRGKGGSNLFSSQGNMTAMFDGVRDAEDHAHTSLVKGMSDGASEALRTKSAGSVKRPGWLQPCLNGLSPSSDEVVGSAEELPGPTPQMFGAALYSKPSESASVASCASSHAGGQEPEARTADIEVETGRSLGCLVSSLGTGNPCRSEEVEDADDEGWLLKWTAPKATRLPVCISPRDPGSTGERRPLDRETEPLTSNGYLLTLPSGSWSAGEARVPAGAGIFGAIRGRPWCACFWRCLPTRFGRLPTEEDV